MQHIDFMTLVEEQRPYIKETDVHTVKQQLDSDENICLIDVREDYEWNQGHLPKAKHLARGIVERDIENIIKDKSTPVVLYCGGGFRSVLSAYNLQQMGYTSVYSMAGGIKDWVMSGYNLVNE